jgi:large subunit ribosomal protein L29
MTANMKSKEIRRRASTDLREEVKRLEKAVFDHRFRGQSEEKSDRGLVRRSRRDVARILTVLRERELAGTEGTTGAAARPAAAAAGAVAKKSPARKAAAGKKE